MTSLPHTHTRTYKNPEFNDDPFSDNELLCPFCKTGDNLSIAGSQCGISSEGLDVITGLFCSNCEKIFYLALFKSKHSNSIHFEIAQLIPHATDQVKPHPEPEPIKRKPIKPSLRFEILKRDNYRCQMCGVTAKDGATLEIDHITPVSKGGTNEASNLQVLCRDCNAGKSDSWQ
jgi:hypothetical protein